MMNGRVDVSSSRFSNMPFPMFENENQHNSTNCNRVGNMGNRERTPLTDVFFSRTNIDALQEAIRYQVFQQSVDHVVIDRQSEVDLRIIMNSVYLEYAKELPYDIVGQVRNLNKIVLQQTVPKIVREVQMYLTYRDDISQLPTPLERSVNVSNRGTKTLETKQF